MSRTICAGSQPDPRARAAAMLAHGRSLREIARALGVSHQTVANWLGPRGRDRALERARHEQRLAEAARLRAQGLTFREISAHIGVAHQTIAKWFRTGARTAEAAPEYRAPLAS